MHHEPNETVLQVGTVFWEEATKFFWDGKNTMSMYARNKLARYIERTFLIVHVTTGRAETAFASIRNKFKFTTFRATPKRPP